MESLVCWSCGAARAPSDALCGACGKVQPVPPVRAGERSLPVAFDKFAVLGVPRGFDQDEAALEDRFRAVSRKLHPDRFARAAPQERRYALEQTTRLNDAWRSLKDPIKRAEHLLELRGVHLAGEPREKHGLQVAQPVTMSPEFLEEMMEDREKLMEAKFGDGGPDEVARLASGVRGKRDEALREVGEMLRALEASELGAATGRDRDCTPAEVAERLARLRYYARYLDEVEGRAVET